MKNFTRIAAFAGMTAALLTSCSNEESLDLNPNLQNPGKISFSAVTPGNTRAANVYCSANPLEDFTVYAKTDAGVFINGELVAKDGSAYKTARDFYWPETGDVLFFGAKNGVFDWNETGDAPQFKDFAVADESKDQVDLMYARTTGSKAANGEDAVKMNFRHALSQVAFQAENVSDKLDITFRGVTVANVSGSATYTFPTVNTDANLQHPTPSADVADNSRGSWSDFGAAKNFSVSFADVNLDETNKVYSLTTNAAGTEYNDNTLLLIPNAGLTAWDPEATSVSRATGTYFILDAKIISKAQKEGEVDQVLYDGNIYVPVNLSNWNEGVRYVYTFIFGNGDAGYNEETKPVLVPIKFTCDIDEFIPAEAEEVDMTTKKD